MYGRLPIWTAPTRLRYRLAAVAGGGLLALSIVVSPPSASWLIASAVWAAVVGYARYRLGQNHAEGADVPSERLGIANGVTLFRGWLLALFAGIADPSTLVPAGVFVCAALLDVVDGAIARRTRETVLGARLDGATDALTLLVGSVAGAALGVLPVWYALAGGVWYGYSGALLARKVSGRTVHDLPESRLRPLVGSAQFLVVAVALWPGVAVPDPIAAAAFVALIVSFVRDWGAATGRLSNRWSLPG
jgi:CDP-diacylglycerol--glycerol-3-phosphate 3-phosphatidyltransferase